MAGGAWSLFLTLVVVSLGVAVLLTRLSLRISVRFGLLDSPGFLKAHTVPTPRLGGIGILAGTLSGFGLSLIVGESSWLGLGLVAACLIVSGTGVIDDVRGLKPLQKLAGQLIAGGLFAAVLYTSTSGQSVLPLTKVALISGAALFLAFASNALNLIDGVDGLAAGTGMLISLFYIILSIAQRNTELSAFLLALGGALAGFMLYNRPPARTFMGDSGSLLVGLALGMAGVWIAFSSPVPGRGLLASVSVLGVPITDAVLAIARRVVGATSVLAGDRAHSYDLIAKRFGGGPWRTLFVMWGLTVLSGVTGLVIYFTNVPGYIVTVPPLIMGAVTYMKT